MGTSLTGQQNTVVSTSAHISNYKELHNFYLSKKKKEQKKEKEKW